MGASPARCSTGCDESSPYVGLRPTGDEPEPLIVGDPAELHVLRSPAEELDLLAALVQERLDAGVDPGDVAVLVEVAKKGDAVIGALRDAGIATHKLADYEGEHAEGVLVGTFSRAKGLEFKEVFIPGLAAAEWPSRWFLPPDLEGEARAERLAVQLRTLFVGCRGRGTGWSSCRAASRVIPSSRPLGPWTRGSTEPGEQRRLLGEGDASGPFGRPRRTIIRQTPAKNGDGVAFCRDLLVNMTGNASAPTTSRRHPPEAEPRRLLAARR